jgi:hypothetical protein
MTAELQLAMARYEEARIRYRKAVLASLDGTSGGDAIRQAIAECQQAGAELKRLQGGPSAQAARRRAPEPARKGGVHEQVIPGWAFVRKLLSTA